MKTDKENRSSLPGERRITWKDFFLLQGAVILYTLAGVAGKFAAGQQFLSVGFIFLYGAEIMVLGIYALIWQQLMKRYELSVAYANRAMALLWSMLWAVLLFQEQITWKNIFGTGIALGGTMIVNGEKP